MDSHIEKLLNPTASLASLSLPSVGSALSLYSTSSSCCEDTQYHEVDGTPIQPASPDEKYKEGTELLQKNCFKAACHKLQEALDLALRRKPDTHPWVMKCSMTLAQAQYYTYRHNGESIDLVHSAKAIIIKFIETCSIHKQLIPRLPQAYLLKSKLHKALSEVDEEIGSLQQCLKLSTAHPTLGSNQILEASKRLRTLLDFDGRLVKLLETCSIKTPKKPFPKSKLPYDVGGKCSVCMDKQVEIVFFPCFHACVCDDCSDHLQECPVCRTDIANMNSLIDDI